MIVKRSREVMSRLARNCSTRRNRLEQVLGRNNTKVNSQGYCERSRYYHCSGRNNLAKTRFLILKADEMIGSSESGDQVHM